MRKHAPDEALIMLVGNKVDLVKEEDNLRQVSHRVSRKLEVRRYMGMITSQWAFGAKMTSYQR